LASSKQQASECFKPEDVDELDVVDLPCNNAALAPTNCRQVVGRIIQSSAFISAQSTLHARTCAINITRRQWSAVQSTKSDFIEQDLSKLFSIGSYGSGTTAEMDHAVAQISEWQSRMTRDFLALTVLVQGKGAVLPDMAIINLIRCLCDGLSIGNLSSNAESASEDSMPVFDPQASEEALNNAQERHKEFVFAMSARIVTWLCTPQSQGDVELK
jgi:hypothetical protein